MQALYRTFLTYLAAATDRELARHIAYLRVENEILRAKLPERIRVMPQERQRLVKYGKLVGDAIKHLVTIVSPRTFMRWLDDEKPEARKAKPRSPGRPKTEEEICELVLRLARETGWGYTRILGELKKLGVRKLSRNTVKNILREARLDPSPERSKGTWDRFVRQHLTTLWACDNE